MVGLAQSVIGQIWLVGTEMENHEEIGKKKPKQALVYGMRTRGNIGRTGGSAAIAT